MLTGFPPFREIRVAGTARERGRAYAEALGDRLNEFHEQEVLATYARWGIPKDEFLRRCDPCLDATRNALPPLLTELEGMSEVCGIPLRELHACLCHEEMFHYPSPEDPHGHCICFAVSTSDSGTGDAWNGQTWDWMRSTYGHSFLTHWQDESGHRILFYSYPAIPYGAGMNGHGLALTWFSGGLWDRRIPAGGVPAYALIYGILQRASIAEAVAWLRETPHAGWFNFVLSDAHGYVACIEAGPGHLSPVISRGYLARNNLYYTSELRKGVPNPEDKKYLPPYWKREGRLLQLLQSSIGQYSPELLKAIITEAEGDYVICYGPPEIDNPDSGMSVDAFFFQPLAKKAWFVRGPIENRGPGPWTEVEL